MGSQQAGERAAVVLSLIESAKLNGHDPWSCLEDVFERLPTLEQRTAHARTREVGVRNEHEDAGHVKGGATGQRHRRP